MSLVQEKALIKIKTLTPKIAAQITVVNFDSRANGLFMKIRTAYREEKAEVIGWVAYDAIDLPSVYRPASGRLWLVELEGDYYWIPSPDLTSSDWIHQNPKQLFIG